MTKKWYAAVLAEIKPGSTVLDVGIGTATALLENKETLVVNKIEVIGVDYDAPYIQAAFANIKRANLSKEIVVFCRSIYDEDLKSIVPVEADVGYFSGSWSLMPDPVEAIRATARLLKKDGSGDVFITQTFQRRGSGVMRWIKPILRYLTTIDFGQLRTVSQMEDYLEELKQPNSDGMYFTIEKKEVIKGSVDNMFQAAYLIKMKRHFKKNN